MRRLTAIGNFHVHGYAAHWRGLKDALRDQVEEVQILDYRTSTPGQVIASMAEFAPDVVLFGTADAMTEEALDRAREIGAFTALWYCDLRWPEQLDIGDRLGLLAMTGSGWLPAYEQAWALPPGRTLWLPQACLPLAEMPKPDPEWACDILHIGSAVHPRYHAERKHLLKEIAHRYGSRFRWLDPKTDEEKAAVTAKLPVLYASAKVSVGVSADTVAGYHSNRLFLAIGNGGMYLCNWFERLAELFEPAIEVAAFGGHDPMDPMEHLDCWLSDERSREINRKHGFARAQRDHTYPVRVRQLLAEIEARR